MNRKNLVRMVLAVALSCAALALGAQQALEIIPLRHRTVEQVLPALQPLVEPGATLSGSRGQLFLRASPANVAEIRRALEAIDRPARRLQISVRFDDALARERRGIEASGTIGSGGARVGITADDARRAATERVDQRLQVLEGSRAFIFTGEQTGAGFEVVPRLAGSVATLDLQAGGASTTLSARLGEWVEVGGIAGTQARDERGIGAARQSQSTGSSRIWLKVEELPN
jgi:type II secretory pathway component GspD/PulD (secretin)